MSNSESLLKLLEEAKKQVDESPNLMKNPEPPPGLSTKQWLEEDDGSQK